MTASIVTASIVSWILHPDMHGIAGRGAPIFLAVVALIVTTAALVVWRFAPLNIMAGGALFGILRDRVWAR